mgnify:CR=1 FL=1
MRLLEWLIATYPAAKKTTLRRMVEDGRVRINGQPARSVRQAVNQQDIVRVEQPSRSAAPTLAPLLLIHEDADVLVVNKPAGLLTNTVARERRATAIGIVRAYLKQTHPRARAGVVHRLDRDASGLLVFSKNDAAYVNLKRQFFHHTVQRIYTAVVHGRPSPPAGTIESRLVELTDGSVRTTRLPNKGDPATTQYQTLATNNDLSLLQVTLHTGRKHQIRVHMNQRGHPVVGDTVYGGRKDDKSRLLLAATSLAFDHPRTGKRLTFTIAPPVEIARLFPEATP